MVNKSKEPKEGKTLCQKHSTIAESGCHGQEVKIGKILQQLEWGWEYTMKIVATSKSELECIDERDDQFREAYMGCQTATPQTAQTRICRRCS